MTNFRFVCSSRFYRHNNKRSVPQNFFHRYHFFAEKFNNNKDYLTLTEITSSSRKNKNKGKEKGKLVKTLLFLNGSRGEEEWFVCLRQ